MSYQNYSDYPSSSTHNFESRETDGPQTSSSNDHTNQYSKGAIRKYPNSFPKKPHERKYRNNHNYRNNSKVSDQGKQNNYENNNSGNQNVLSSDYVVNDVGQYRERNFYPKNSNYSNYKYDNNAQQYNYGNGPKYYNKQNYGRENWFSNNRRDWSRDKNSFDKMNNHNHVGNSQSNSEPGQQISRNRQPYFKRKWKDNPKKEKGAKKMDVASQRGRLEEMIKGRTLECLVCCEIFKYNDKIWSCKQCHHILHLKCTKAWAESSKAENGWRCPACQNVCTEIPDEYRCFCGKVKDPRNEPGLIPHTCGDVCLRERGICEHRCVILCHPGPCPDCTVMVKKSCGCGKTEQQVKCSSDIGIVCNNKCDKTLECTLHKCQDLCHIDSCKPCEEILNQNCYCGKEHRDVDCSAEFKGKVNYSCGEICDKLLSCGNHRCEEKCHEGSCKGCVKDVNLIKTCFCGRSPLKAPRTSCLDPIPSCGLMCRKILKCGPPAAPHICKSLCHEGDCPSCDQTTVLKCRCGFMDKEIPCEKLTTKADDARCEKKCTKKRLCGKHKCNQRCCIEVDHLCPLPCNHLLSCGNHRCQMTCHSGRCKPCMETSFEELYCECGSSVLYPPVPCGTKPPICDKPCARSRECDHEVHHTCHTGPCPPCTVLCKRWCYGKHEQRGTIPCHQENFSCGLPCGKQMPCGKHKCTKPCHLGNCPVPCKQPCMSQRPICGHPCNAPCHDPPCPEINCRSKVPVCCVCGVQKGFKSCNEVADEFRNIEMALLSEKMLNISRNQAVDISDMRRPKRPDVLKILECNEECKVVERNRRLAIGLQIRNPDISQKLTPRYSEFMRQWAKKDPHFCQRVHNKLTELVQLAKQSKQKSRSYSFESMNRDKRHFIHEYCEHFGCESAAYDAEPNRNIVATAIRDKSWLPGMSLMETIQRENGQRKVPGPSVLDKISCTKSESVTLKSMHRTSKASLASNESEAGKQ